MAANIVIYDFAQLNSLPEESAYDLSVHERRQGR
jgi:hypothetical protein